MATFTLATDEQDTALAATNTEVDLGPYRQMVMQSYGAKRFGIIDVNMGEGENPKALRRRLVKAAKAEGKVLTWHSGTTDERLIFRVADPRPASVKKVSAA